MINSSIIRDHYLKGHRVTFSQEESLEWGHTMPIYFTCSCGAKEEFTAVSALALLDEYVNLGRKFGENIKRCEVCGKMLHKHQHRYCNECYYTEVLIPVNNDEDEDMCSPK
jgi:hypothetical protein